MLLLKICLISTVCVLATYGSPTDEHVEEYRHHTHGHNEFGYDNGVNGSFHFQNQTAEGFTSGCYGHNGKNSQRTHVTYYITDAAGFRVIQPNRPTKVVVPHANSTAQERTWQQLGMPEGCTKNHPLLATVQSDAFSGQMTVGDPGTVAIPANVVTGLLTVINSLVGIAAAGPGAPAGVQNDLGLGGILNLPISLLNGLLGIVNGVLGGLLSAVGGIGGAAPATG